VGEFEFLAVPKGESTVRVRYVGFAAAEQIVMAGHAPELHVQLRLAAQRTSVEVSETQDALGALSSTPESLVTRRSKA